MSASNKVARITLSRLAINPHERRQGHVLLPRPQTIGKPVSRWADCLHYPDRKSAEFAPLRVMIIFLGEFDHDDVEWPAPCPVHAGYQHQPVDRLGPDGTNKPTAADAGRPADAGTHACADARGFTCNSSPDPDHRTAGSSSAHDCPGTRPHLQRADPHLRAQATFGAHGITHSRSSGPDHRAAGGFSAHAHARARARAGPYLQRADSDHRSAS